MLVLYSPFKTFHQSSGTLPPSYQRLFGFVEAVGPKKELLEVGGGVCGKLGW